jgi:hypothetical protein
MRAEARKEKIFNPAQDAKVLDELINEAYNKKYGEEITMEQSSVLFEMNAKREKLIEDFDTTKGEWKNKKSQFEYGSLDRAHAKYMQEIVKGKNLKVKEIFKEYVGEIKDIYKEDKLSAFWRVVEDSAKVINDNLISVVGTWDNSFLGRQGIITLSRNPKIWWKMATESFENGWKSISKKGGGEQAIDALMAEAAARPNGMLGWYKEGKLFPEFEEAFPTSLPGRVPGIGRAFDASMTAFQGSAIRARMELFDMFANMAKKKGMEMDTQLARDIGNHVNAITARGKVGAIGGSPVTKLLLWAPRMLKADWDILTAHTGGKGLKTNLMRKQAARTILQTVALTAATAAMAEGMGADVEWDPRSNKFLSIKWGNTTFKNPFPRGMAQIVTLLARGFTQQTKNSMGLVKDINTGAFGEETIYSLGFDFLANKTTPPVHAVIDYAKGRMITGEKPTPLKTAKGFLPISVQNVFDIAGDDMSLSSAVGAMFDFIGVSTSTYQRKTNWEDSDSASLKQFNEKVGEEKFQEANDKFNDRFNAWFKEMEENDKFQSEDNETKQKVITKKKADIKETIFREYGFHYKADKKTKVPNY